MNTFILPRIFPARPAAGMAPLLQDRCSCKPGVIAVCFWICVLALMIHFGGSRESPDEPAAMLEFKRLAQLQKPQRQPLATARKSLKSADKPDLERLVNLARGENNFLVVASSGTGDAALTDNWIENLRQVDPAIRNYVMIALDETEYLRLRDRKVPVYFDGGLGSGASGDKALTHSTIMRKWSVVLRTIKLGVDVLLSDVDVAFLRSPVHYMQTLATCDAYFATASHLLFPSNSLWFPSGEAVLGTWKLGNKLSLSKNAVEFQNYISAGFSYWRATESSSALLSRIVASVSTTDGTLDNEGEKYAINFVLQRELEEHPADSNIIPPSTLRPCCANYGSFTFHVLTPFLFQDGKHARHMKLTEVIHEPPFVRQYTHLIGGTEDKIAMMKADGVWLLQD